MILHATTVSVCGAGLMILGPSGSGKSGLALQMICLGAELVADDRTLLSRPDDGPPLAASPPTIAGLIEARGLGLIKSPCVASSRLHAVLDLSYAETERLPERQTKTILGFDLQVVRRVDTAWFPSALVIWLRSGTPVSGPSRWSGHT